VVGVRTHYAHHKFMSGPRPLDCEGLRWLRRDGFFSDTFKSFFAGFGYMDLFLPRLVYEALALGLVFFWGWALARLTRLKDRRLWAAFGVLAAFAVLAFAQHLLNGLLVDDQGQGRYLFPVLVPTALFLGLWWRLDRRSAPLAWAAAGSALSLLAVSTVWVARAYGLWAAAR
jgi:hypothetical protein